MRKLKEKLRHSKLAFLSITSATWLLAIVAMYVAGVVMQNIFEMKTIGTPNFAIFGGGLLLSWIVFAAMDIVTEVWGKKTAVKIFTFASVVNLVVVLLAQLVIALPGTYPDMSNAFTLIMSNGIRTVIASVFAFWIGNYINATIMDKMRKQAVAKKQEKNGWLFALRAIVSTFFGQILDNLLFVTLAFAPIGISAFEMNWIDIISSVALGTTLETVLEAAFVPFLSRPASKHLIEKLNAEAEQNNKSKTSTPETD